MRNTDDDINTLAAWRLLIEDRPFDAHMHKVLIIDML